MAAQSLFRELYYAIELATEAAKILKENYSAPAGTAGTEEKPDGTLVSNADRKVSEMLRENLSREFPGYALLDEEQKDDPRRFNRECNYCWFTDPLDNTQDYLNKEGKNFGTIIGLTYQFQPLLGVVSRGEEIFCAVKGQGAYCLQEDKKSRLQVSSRGQVELLIAKSRNNSHLEKLVDAFRQANVVQPANIVRMNGSLKSMEIALGRATLFLSHPSNTTHLWDHCGTSVIVEEAGGKYTDFYGSPIDFSSPDTAHRKGAIVSSALIHQRILDLVRSTASNENYVKQ